MRNLAKATAFALFFGNCTLSLAAGQFRAGLSGGQEVPPNASLAAGDAQVKLDNDGKSIRVQVKFNGLGSNVTGAHVHNGAAGSNGPVVVDLSPTTGVTSGSVEDFTATLSAVQAADLEAGKLYVNVHSTAYPDGEIRGQLVPNPDNAVNEGAEATDAPANAIDAGEATTETEQD